MPYFRNKSGLTESMTRTVLDNSHVQDWPAMYQDHVESFKVWNVSFTFELQYKIVFDWPDSYLDRVAKDCFEIISRPREASIVCVN